MPQGREPRPTPRRGTIARQGMFLLYLQMCMLAIRPETCHALSCFVCMSVCVRLQLACVRTHKYTQRPDM